MIGVLGDTHLGKSLGKFDLTPYIRSSMWKFFDFCLDRKVQAAIHLGDLVDSPKMSLEREKILIQWANEFERAKLPIYIMNGNHDVTAHQTVSSALSVLKSIPYEYVTVVERPSLIEVAGYEILFLPFPSPSLFSSYDPYLVEAKKEYDKATSEVVVVSHLNVYGAKLGDQEFVYRGEDFCIPDFVTESSQTSFVVNGHIHKAQAVENVFMLGAAQRFSFGEASNPVRFGIISDSMYRTFDVSDRVGLSLFKFELNLGTTDKGVMSTQSAVDLICRGKDVVGSCIKISPLVDSNTLANLDDISSTLYSRGVSFVWVAPAKRLEVDGEVNSFGEVTDNPFEAVKTYLNQTVKSSQDKKRRYKLFRNVANKVMG